MIPLGPVVARSRLQAARSAAWSYLADEGRRGEWWPELRLDPRLGGEIVERWTESTGESSVSRDASGKIDVWVDGHAIGFTWREAGDVRDTAVLLTLRSQGAETGITVTETGFDALPNAAARAAGSQEGWQVLLRDLTLAVETAAAEGRLPVDPDAAAGSDAVPAAAVAAGAPAADVLAEAVPDAAASAGAAEGVGAEGIGAAGIAAAGLDTDEANPADDAAAAASGGSGAADATADQDALTEELTDAPTEAQDRAEVQTDAAPGAHGEASDGVGLDDELNDTVKVERLVTPAQAPPPAEAAVPAEPAGDAREDRGEGPDEGHNAAELDFDALIRGEHPEHGGRDH